MKRREFIKVGTAAAAGLMVGASQAETVQATDLGYKTRLVPEPGLGLWVQIHLDQPLPNEYGGVTSAYRKLVKWVDYDGSAVADGADREPGGYPLQAVQAAEASLVADWRKATGR